MKIICLGRPIVDFKRYFERRSREKLGHVLGLLCPSVSKNSIKAKPFVDARATRVSRDAAMGVRLKGSKKGYE